MIIPGIVSATFREKTAEDIIRICKEAELKAVEWSENAHVFPGDEKGAADLYEETRKAGLQVAAYGSYFKLGQNENPVEVFRQSVISAAALHAPVIRIWAGTEASEVAEKEERMRLAREAADVCTIAEEYGIKVALEWHRNTLTDTNESAFRFLEEVNHSNLYCLWQPTAALTVEERIEGVKKLGDRLLNLHIYYWPQQGVRRPLEEGVELWRQYLEQVDRSVTRFGLLEFVMNNEEEQLKADARVLRKLVIGE